MDDLLPIGRFAKATRLSVKALRHYDELGLLRPAFVDPSSGYRYYRPAQANQAEAIRILRSLEMPLEEIAALLAEAGGEPVAKRLALHRERLEARAWTSTDGCWRSSNGSWTGRTSCRTR